MNLLIYYIFSVIHVFTDICLNDFILQCKNKLAMPAFIYCTYRLNLILFTISIIYYYSIVELKFIILL